VLLVVPPGFQGRLERGTTPAFVYLVTGEKESSRLVGQRVKDVLGRWKEELKKVRLARAGLPDSFDEPFKVTDPEARSRQADEEGLFGLMVRIFPFILVLWSLAGALYPAVDLCAGEKERGTMETLLISPASREEIVFGKFLTIWVVSAATALLNLLSMGLTLSGGWVVRWLGGSATTQLPNHLTTWGALFWGLLLLLPLSAFFSAVCLAVGAYARSSKEGQYYLMPLFLVTMPLIFLTLAPGVELNPFYSMVPVTGVALLLQRLMGASGPDGSVWLYFVPVLAPMVIYSWLALRWAIYQFNREEVLFREAERLDLGLWLRHLWRDKESLPTVGEAFFCFGLILLLHRLNVGAAAGSAVDLAVRLGVGYLAFVAAPPLFMALLLTTRPREGLALRWPKPWALLAALVLALLLFVPGAELTYFIIQSLGLKESLREYENTLQRAQAGAAPVPLSLEATLVMIVGLALLQAVCEELAFRGYILSGLLRRFRPWTAILLSSFLFALFQMNVFQFAAHFLLGIVLGVLVWKGGSLLPAVLFHFAYTALVYTCLVVGPEQRPDLYQALGYESLREARYLPVRVAVSLGCLTLAGLLVAQIARRRPSDP
jgi:sodium transport system permease protein